MDDHLALIWDLRNLVEMEFDLLMTRGHLNVGQRLCFRQILAALNYRIKFSFWQIK
jgi:hypothetical protein